MEETAVAVLKSTTTGTEAAHLATNHAALSAASRADLAATVGAKTGAVARLASVGKLGLVPAKLGATAKATASAGAGIAAHLRGFLSASVGIMQRAGSTSHPRKPGHAARHASAPRGTHSARAPAHPEKAGAHPAAHARSLPKVAHAAVGSKGSLGAKGILLALKASASAKAALGVGLGLAGIALAAHTGTLAAAAHGSCHVVAVSHGRIQIEGSGGVSISIGV